MPSFVPCFLRAAGTIYSPPPCIPLLAKTTKKSNELYLSKLFLLQEQYKLSAYQQSRSQQHEHRRDCSFCNTGKSRPSQTSNRSINVITASSSILSPKFSRCCQKGPVVLPPDHNPLCLLKPFLTALQVLCTSFRTITCAYNNSLHTACFKAE